MISRSFTQFRARRGFSLLEVLLAMFILGIGLVMVATIFPVGANWTRQASEDSVAQTVAANAVSVIKDSYAANGLNANTAGKITSNVLYNSDTNLTPTSLSQLKALPNFSSIPVGERCYRYGNDNPFPVANPAACTYYWTALVRPLPVAQGQPISGGGRSFDLYILVFRKGDPINTFTPAGGFFDTSSSPSLVFSYSSSDEVGGVRDPLGPVSYVTASSYDGKYEPTLIHHAYSAGTSSKNGTECIPPIGYFGIGTTSGTVFRQGYDYNANTAAARPGVAGNEDVIFAPPADGSSGSPLIYVYQTTVTF